MTRKLTCAMKRDCPGPVTHVDAKGYVYCAAHGQQRKYDVRCRKLTTAERKRLEAGDTITYEKRTLAIVAVAVLVSTAIGCTSPLSPSYTCATKPRTYALTNGQTSTEVDHYSSATPCPIVPID